MSRIRLKFESKYVFKKIMYLKMLQNGTNFSGLRVLKGKYR